MVCNKFDSIAILPKFCEFNSAASHLGNGASVLGVLSLMWIFKTQYSLFSLPLSFSPPSNTMFLISSLPVHTSKLEGCEVTN